MNFFGSHWGSILELSQFLYSSASVLHVSAALNAKRSGIALICVQICMFTHKPLLLRRCLLSRRESRSPKLCSALSSRLSVRPRGRLKSRWWAASHSNELCGRQLHAFVFVRMRQRSAGFRCRLWLHVYKCLYLDNWSSQLWPVCTQLLCWGFFHQVSWRRSSALG